MPPVKLIYKGNKYDYILALCAGESKQWSSPFGRATKDYATNSFLAISVPNTLPAKTYEFKDLEVETVFEKIETTDVHTIVIETSALLGMVAEYGLYMDTRTECAACHGRGDEECFHCGHESTCEDCNGSGKKGEQKPIHTFKFSKNTMKLDGYDFTPAYLHIMALVAAVLGDNDIEIEIRGSKAHITYSNGVEGLLMLQHKSK